MDPTRIAVIGGSKGGELALLLGSRRADLKAVIGVVPGSATFQSIARGWPRTSSWTVGGKDLPFVPYARSAEFRQTGRLSFLYEASLRNTRAVTDSTIPVEKTRGSILLISGRDGWVWPSSRMSDAVVALSKRSGSSSRSSTSRSGKSDTRHSHPAFAPCRGIHATAARGKLMPLRTPKS